VPPDTVVVFAGGPPAAALPLPDGAVIVAADGGAEHALARGLRIEVTVGDFDSTSPSALAQLQAAGVRLERHPVEKDATDLELALDAALAFEPRRLLVLGSAGGRLDHLIALLLLLAADAYATVEMDAVVDDALAYVVRRERTLPGEPGGLLSLFALRGDAEGVVTHGLRYPLRGETLRPGSTRGVSNVFAAPEARVTVARGVLLAVRPGSGEAGSASS
jgi:thiamine pyrophosphokinase